MAGIRRPDPAWLFAAIERQGIGAKVFAPKRGLEICLQSLRIGAQFISEIKLAEAIRELAGMGLGVEDITLHSQRATGPCARAPSA